MTTYSMHTEELNDMINENLNMELTFGVQQDAEFDEIRFDEMSVPSEFNDIYNGELTVPDDADDHHPIELDTAELEYIMGEVGNPLIGPHAHALWLAQQREHGCENNLEDFLTNNERTLAITKDFPNSAGMQAIFYKQDDMREETNLSFESDRGDYMVKRAVCFKYSRRQILEYIKRQQYTYMNLKDTTKVRLYWLGSVYNTLQTMLDAVCLRNLFSTDIVREEESFVIPRHYMKSVICMTENELVMFSKAKVFRYLRPTYLTHISMYYVDNWHDHHRLFAESNARLIGKDLNYITSHVYHSLSDAYPSYFGRMFVYNGVNEKGRWMTARQTRLFEDGVPDLELEGAEMPRTKKNRQGKRKEDINSLLVRRYILTGGDLHEYLMERTYNKYDI